MSLASVPTSMLHIFFMITSEHNKINNYLVMFVEYMYNGSKRTWGTGALHLVIKTLI